MKQVQTLHTEIFKIQHKFTLRESLAPSNLSKVLEIRNNHEFIQVADPFLWEVDGELMVYYEKKHFKKPGSLHLMDVKTKIEKKIELGREIDNVHLSFPFLLEVNGDTFLIPETHEKQEVSLYKRTSKGSFEKFKTLISGGSFVDSIIWQADGLWYLMTTEMKPIVNAKGKEYIRRLFFTANLELNFTEHPQSPVARGRKFGRLGGSLINWNGKQYLPVQDCSNRYGEDINLFQITQISAEVYQEEIYIENVFKEVLGFKRGGHHLNILEAKNKDVYVAIDLNGLDSVYNKVLRKFNN